MATEKPRVIMLNIPPRRPWHRCQRTEKVQLGWQVCTRWRWHLGYHQPPLDMDMAMRNWTRP